MNITLHVTSRWAMVEMEIEFAKDCPKTKAIITLESSKHLTKRAEETKTQNIWPHLIFCCLFFFSIVSISILAISFR